VQSIGRVSGVKLVVTKEWWRPRVLRDGQELPRDRWGTYQFHDNHGRPCPLTVSYSWWELRPRVVVVDQSVLFETPVAWWARVALLALIAAGFFGGALGALLALRSAGGSLALLRRPDRRPWHVVGALMLPLLAVLVYGIVAVLLRGGR